MEQKAVLLNGGRELDVKLVPGTGEFLARLLGSAPSKPIVPSLRLVENAPGQRSVGVFIGSRQVGLLAQPNDQELVATLRACQLNGAVARARGSLLSSTDEENNLAVKVDLAESERLLSDPDTTPPTGSATEAPDRSAFEPVTEPLDRSAFEPAAFDGATSSGDRADAPPSPSSEDSAGPELLSGYSEDYPDWPPRDLGPADPVRTGDTDSPAPDTGPEPATAPQPTSSPETLLSTRSAWLGAMPTPTTASQPGWLSSSRPATQDLELGQGQALSQMPLQPAAAQTGWLGAPGQPSETVGSASTASDAAPTAPSDGGSWQDYADKARPSGESPPPGWTPGASVNQPAAKPAPSPLSNKTKAWIAGVLVVAVLAGAGFALWKTFLASKTYTDPEYGYSFSYPGGWDKMDLTNDIASTALVTADEIPPIDAVVVGSIDGDSRNMPDEFSVAVVGLFDTGVLVDEGMIATAMQETEWELAQMPDMGYGVSFGVVEPPTLTTVRGLRGYTMILSMEAYGISTYATYCFLFDGSIMYILGGMCDADTWGKFEKTFDSLVASFQPGGTRL